MGRNVSRQAAGRLISQLMPFVIQGAHLEFLAGKTITQTQFLVLVAIYSSRRSTMKKLADSMHVSMPTISGVVDRLVRAGYLCRLTSAEDRRHVVVELSPRGRAFISQFQQTISRRWQEVLGLLNSQDLVSFSRIIMAAVITGLNIFKFQKRLS